MGVTGLWKLIEPCGQPIPVEMLENKVLAVDISIWLHQVVKGFQDNRGSALANSHLLGLFHRLCKLMYYRIKPVFVFDGKVPSLKRETIAKRNQKRNKLVNEAERIQTLLLQSLAKEKVVQQALGTKATDELLKASPSKNNKNRHKDSDEDIFKLPDLPKTNELSVAAALETDSEEPSSSNSESDTSFTETKHRFSETQNLQAIDVKSDHFRKLPADIRHEILIDIKETRKQSSWGKLHELPSKSNDFSTFQMKRLLKRRQVQESIEEVEKEMDGVRTFTISELENIFSEEGIIDGPSVSNTKHISSDANTRYLLIKDLKETLANAAASQESKEKIPPVAKETKKLEDVCEDELEMAIKMSLDDSAPYSESDYQCNDGYKLSRDQRSQLKNAGVGLARAFMIEHAGMNAEDVKSLLESTQMSCTNESLQEHNDTMQAICNSLKDEENTNSTEVALSTEKQSLKIEVKDEPLNLNSPESQKQPTREIGIISDSSSDSEFEEVKDIDTEPLFIDTKTELPKVDTKMEIFVDLSKASSQEDDIFADCFTATEEELPKKLPKVDTNPATSTSLEECSKSTAGNHPIKTKPPPSVNMSDILKDLQKQASEVTKINLADIKIEETLIEISDDDSIRLSQPLEIDTDCDKPNCSLEKINKSSTQEESTLELSPSKNISKPSEEIPDCKPISPKFEEVIEIIDEDAQQKSGKSLTPSKTRDISDFFETKFKIKRTPEKSEEQEEVIPKITSPFFVRKSPKSSNEKTPRKRTSANDDNDESPAKRKVHKVNKMLFEDTSPPPPIVTKELDALEVAAKNLKENNTTEELESIASKLAKEKFELEKERNRQDRMGMTITEKMNSECMELLRLFGIPFIVAPMEAEAQCAFLDYINLTNGTITDDSDIWLFGGTTVYKNFFAQNKHVMEFKYETIKSSFNVDRNKLVQLALLVGSDYTTGINGIGAVTALEILASFSPKDLGDVAPSQQTSAVVACLANFRDWWQNTKSNTVIGSSMRHRLRNKLANIELYGEFPSLAVVEAYLKPKVDNSHNSFSWGTPDEESIREFTRTNFGWTRNKTNEILEPVIQRLNDKKKQSAITNYFAIKSTSSTKQLAVSKRVQNAINCMSSDFQPIEEVVAKPKRATQRKKRASAADAGTSEVLEKKTKPTVKRNVKISKSSDVIPQREKDKEEMAQKKKLAAETLKRTSKKGK